MSGGTSSVSNPTQGGVRRLILVAGCVLGFTAVFVASAVPAVGGTFTIMPISTTHNYTFRANPLGLGDSSLVAETTTFAGPEIPHVWPGVPDPTDAAGTSPALVATTTSAWAGSGEITVGDTTDLVGRVVFAPDRRIYRQPLQLQRLDGSAWVTTTTPSTGDTGYATVGVSPNRTTTYRFVYPGWGGYDPSVSRPVTITVYRAGGAPAAGANGLAAPAGPQGDALEQRVLAVAAAQTGKWYVFGAAGPNTFDCSGLTLYAYRAVGVTLPHLADSQQHYGRAVSRQDARPGDLMIFLSGGYGYHAAIYAGGDYMYDAPHSGATVGLHRIYPGEVVFRRIV
jgi:cell wall-associated NlpC family hydrolase